MKPFRIFVGTKTLTELKDFSATLASRLFVINAEDAKDGRPVVFCGDDAEGEVGGYVMWIEKTENGITHIRCDAEKKYKKITLSKETYNRLIDVYENGGEFKSGCSNYSLCDYDQVIFRTGLGESIGVFTVCDVRNLPGVNAQAYTVKFEPRKSAPPPATPEHKKQNAPEPKRFTESRGEFYAKYNKFYPKCATPGCQCEDIKEVVVSCWQLDKETASDVFNNDDPLWIVTNPDGTVREITTTKPI